MANITLFSQIISKLDRSKFNKLVKVKQTDKHCKGYTLHFLIYSKIKMEDSSHLKYLLEIIGGDKNKYETPYILWEFDYLNFGYSGSYYSFKEKSVFDGLLG